MIHKINLQIFEVSNVYTLQYKICLVKKSLELSKFCYCIPINIVTKDV